VNFAGNLQGVQIVSFRQQNQLPILVWFTTKFCHATKILPCLVDEKA
jgi:hypothetical protein